MEEIVVRILQSLESFGGDVVNFNARILLFCHFPQIDICPPLHVVYDIAVQNTQPSRVFPPYDPVIQVNRVY